MSITLIFGSMYSGKTTELIRRVTRYQSIGKRVLVVNNALDDRYAGDNSIITHDEYSYNCVKCKSLSEIDDIMRLEADVDVVAIDEGQFFPDLKKYVVKFCEKYAKHVVVAGLTGDFQRNKFGCMIDLLNYANNIVHLKAFCTICSDGTLAIFTKKICTGVDQIEVGSTKKYVALCRRCYLNKGSDID